MPESVECHIEDERARGKFFNSLTEEQKKAFNAYTEVNTVMEGLYQHYLYLQGLKDGIALVNAV